MSEENGKVCCNCRYCVRRLAPYSTAITCKCDIDDSYISYEKCMSGWCRHWAKDKEAEDG